MTEASDEGTVKDRRLYPYYQIDNALLDEHVSGEDGIGVHGLAVYNVLARIAGAKGHAWPAMSTIADRLGISRRQVQREIAKLEARGLVEVQRRYEENVQQSSVYLLSHIGPKPAQPKPAEAVQAVGTLWERTLGRVQAAPDHTAKLRELFKLWREAFGGEGISPAQMQQLITEAGGEDALAKAITKAAVAVEPPIANPYALVRRGLGFNKPRAAPAKQPTTEAAGFESSGKDRYSLEW